MNSYIEYRTLQWLFSGGLIYGKVGIHKVGLQDRYNVVCRVWHEVDLEG